MATEEEYQESIRRLGLYVETQLTANQKIRAKHRIHDIQINHTYLLNKETYLCVKCGALETANYVEPTRQQMLKDQTCFYCNHWEQIASKPLRHNQLIINGELFGDGGNSPNSPSQFLGYGGRKWKIRKDGQEWETNNLWSGGTIPQEFRDRLPDNAEFI